MAESLPSKLFDAFLKSFTRTFKEFALHIVIGIAAIAYGLHQSSGSKRVLWDVVVPLSLAFCVEVAWHTVKAAWLLSKEVPAPYRASTILSEHLKPFEVLTERISFYRAKIGGLSSVVVVGCLLFAVLIWIVAGPSLSTPVTTPPILQVRAVLYNPTGVTTKVLNLQKPWTNEINLVSAGERTRTADFILRNIGTADAVNVAVQPQVSTGIKLDCVAYMGFLGSEAESVPLHLCDAPSGVALTIPPRPKDRPEISNSQGAALTSTKGLMSGLKSF